MPTTPVVSRFENVLTAPERLLYLSPQVHKRATMKTDSLFYNIFLTFPETFFALIGLPATATNQYQFTSREVKQLSFRLDGLFYPKFEQPGQTFYLLEVQFQPDPDLYYRIFGELFLFLRQYKPLPTWSVVIIYPNSRVAREVPEHFLLTSSSS